MFRKTISLALAICMFATAFVAIGAAGAMPTITSSIVAVNGAGSPTDVFFDGIDVVYFILTYSVNGLPTSADFRVEMIDGGGNVLDTRYVTTNNPADGQYMSNFTGTHIHTTGHGPDTLTLRAILDDTNMVMAEKSFRCMKERVVIEPSRPSSVPPIFAPGETVTIKVDVDHPDGATGKINLTISPINVTWSDKALVDYHWETTWVIPANATTGVQMFYVNQTNTGDPATILFQDDALDIEYFDVDVVWDKSIYLPGESAIVNYWAWLVPSYTQISITLDVNMTYIDGAGSLAWQNKTVTASPFNITIPAWIDMYNLIGVDYKAYAGANRTATGSTTIETGTVWINDMDLDKDPHEYVAGDSVVVTVEVLCYNDDTDDNAPMKDADVSITMDDGFGNLIPVNKTVKTDVAGMARVTLQLPTNMTESDDYRVIVKVTKLGFEDTGWVYLDIVSAVTVEVLVDKNLYTAGDAIVVKTIVLNNGVPVYNPDAISYSLFATGVPFNEVMVSSLNFTATAPATNAMATIAVYVLIGLDWHVGVSIPFEISTIELILTASENDYYAGDTIDFNLQVVGNAAGFNLRYTIIDNMDITVDSNALTLTDGEATFSLEVPADRNAESYKATVYADNGVGMVVIEDLTVNRAVNYQVIMKVLTAPSSITGAYSPGQTITVSFEIIKQSSDLRNLTVVEAELRDVDESIFGESATFNEMKGELSVTLPDEAFTGEHELQLTIVGLGTTSHSIWVDTQGNGMFNSNVGGMMSVSDLLLTILVIVVILMLLWQMMKAKGAGAAAAGGAEKKPAEPKAKEEAYAPKATVACASCGSPIEVGTSKRPIEVMCPKCGKSQMVN